jgi:hypothetical protein
MCNTRPKQTQSIIQYFENRENSQGTTKTSVRQDQHFQNTNAPKSNNATTEIAHIDLQRQNTNTSTKHQKQPVTI